MKTVCLHGAESTGKSVLCERFLVERGWPFVPEYGRFYCEENGTDLAMEDLLVIAEGQARANRHAMAGDPPVLLLDTDQLMFVIRGGDKREVFDAARTGAHDLPVARLLNAARQPVTCFA